MGIFDTITDEDGNRYQTKWFPVGSFEGSGPGMKRYHLGEQVPEADGDYEANGEGNHMVVVVRQGRIKKLVPEDQYRPGSLKPDDVVQDAIKLLQDLYNNDVLFVELTPAERNEYDNRIKSLLDAFGAEHDGKDPPVKKDGSNL